MISPIGEWREGACGRSAVRWRCAAVTMACCAMLAWSGARVACAQIQAPRYDELRLDSIFPAGGQQGSDVVVEFRGTQGGLRDPVAIVIDGPAGIVARDVKSLTPDKVQATLSIARDAAPGRRWVRVLSQRCGLTNLATFVVGELPEPLEHEPNDDAAKAESVAIPCVVNGAITPQADADCFGFRARAGQRIVAAIAAHAIDIHGQGGNFGIADFHLELLDEAGRVVAASEDALGLDPLVEFVVPRDGAYVARVRLLNNQGFPDAVYRLTLGEVPYVTGAFPGGVQRGVATDVELFGPNVPPGTKQRVLVDANESFPLRYIAWRGIDSSKLASSGCDVPLTWGQHVEQLEVEPNNARDAARTLPWPVTVNGRFGEAGDEDWYAVELGAGQRIWCEVTAHRFLRSPVDTLLRVYDASGKMVAENDDDNAVDPGYESVHDFRTTDSRLLFQAPAAGLYYVQLSEQAGVGSPRHVYRLTIAEARPDFELRHFPDGVPIWGPGSTAAVMVRVDRLADCNDDIELAVEGLPDGWSSRGAVSLGVSADRPINAYQRKLFLTITAPSTAKPGDWAEFRVVGRAKRGETVVERRSWPLTLYYTSDTGFFRISPVGRAAVAKSQGPWLESLTDKLVLKRGGTGQLAVRVHGAESLPEISLVVNLVGPGVGCGLTTPRTLPIANGRVEVPLQLPPEVPVGEFAITTAITWRSDVRVGMPGPCTPLVRLIVEK